MARVTVDKNYFQFTQGKITEASPLSFPENSMKDELNIDINFDGTIQRRKGIDYEPGYTLFGTSFQKVSSSTNPGGPLAQIYKWENVGGYPKETPILVVRYGTHLVFYESLEEPLSSAVVGSMMEVGASESIISDSFLGFAEAKGYLFVVGQGFDPFYIKYNPTTNNFEKTSVTIKIRDLDGLPEDIEDHIRPSTLTGIHRYNLLNQGWPFRRVINKNIVGGTRPVDYEDSPLAFLRDPVRGYPSNSDLYRSYTESGDEKGDMIEAWIRSVPISTSRAPRGKVIIEAFRENRKELAQEYSAKTTPVTPWVPTNYEERSTTSRPTCVTFFQGHVMFSGVNDLDYNDKIYVSQSLVDVSRAGRAYSVNDPTSGIESSPLDTDGGVIRIEGVDRILSLQAIGGHLLVIGNNGLWSIRGAEGGFSVNDIVLNKLSSVGGISASSVVNYEGTVLFWSDSGIYAVSLDSQFDTLSVANITEETIQRDYVAIPEGKKKYANPIVDTLNRKIYWLYNNDATDPINCRMNRVLILDMRTSSFFDYEFPVDENDEYPFVVAGFSKPRIGIFESTELVTVGGVTVTVNSEDVTVTSSVNISTGIGNAIKYLTFKGEDNNWRVLFSELYNTKFVDWASDIDGGVDYVSFVETGYELMDDSMRDMQATYIFTYFNRTEQGFVEVDDPSPGPGPIPIVPGDIYLATSFDRIETQNCPRTRPSPSTGSPDRELPGLEFPPVLTRASGYQELIDFENAFLANIDSWIGSDIGKTFSTQVLRGGNWEEHPSINYKIENHGVGYAIQGPGVAYQSFSASEFADFLLGIDEQELASGDFMIYFQPAWFTYASGTESGRIYISNNVTDVGWILVDTMGPSSFYITKERMMSVNNRPFRLWSSVPSFLVYSVTPNQHSSAGGVLYFDGWELGPLSEEDLPEVITRTREMQDIMLEESVYSSISEASYRVSGTSEARVRKAQTDYYPGIFIYPFISDWGPFLETREGISIEELEEFLNSDETGTVAIYPSRWKTLETSGPNSWLTPVGEYTQGLPAVEDVSPAYIYKLVKKY